MAERQDGLLTVAQAAAAGLSDDAIRHRIRTGRLKKELPGVLAVTGAPASRRRQIRAATMWGGKSSAASFTSAARLFGLDIARTGVVHISLTRWKQHRELCLPDDTPIKVHRLDDYLTGEIATIDDIPLTSARKTILDLCGAGHLRAERFLDFCLAGDIAYVGDIWLYLEKEWMRGRRGVRRLRDLLIPRTQGYGPSDSDLELMFRGIVHRYGLPTPIPQYPIELPFSRIHADFAYPEARVVIELDSHSFHLNRKAFEQDRERDIELTMLRWKPLRFTWAMLKFDEAHVADVVRRALALTA